MKISMNLLLWGTYIGVEDFSLFKALKKMGFDGVEIPVFEGDISHYVAMKQAVSDAGLECTVITCCDSSTNVASTSSALRENGLNYLKWVVDIADALGAKMVVGPYYAPHGYFDIDDTLEFQRQRSAKVIKKLARYAGRFGIKLSLEFLNRFETRMLNCAHDTAHFVDLVDEPNVGVLYDTHHANIEEESIDKAFDEVGHTFSHIHFSESHRGICGQGLVDWKQTQSAVRKLDYTDWVVIEMFAHDVPGFSEIAHMWRPLCSDKLRACQQSLQFVRSLQ